MSHEIEIVDGVAKMAYAGETPWHGLGKRVPADLTPDQMLEAAGLNWTVKKVKAYARVDGKHVPMKTQALVRSTDGKILDEVATGWNPVQNHEAFAFFNEFVGAGDMEMHTAGSLLDGQITWALAKVKESFTVAKGKDRVDSYLMFSNPHKYGSSIDIRFTPIRVVCNNTLSLSLGTASKNFVKVSHRVKFDPDRVKEVLGIAHQKLSTYKAAADFLSAKRYDKENIVEYFKRIFPVTGVKDQADAKKEMSRSATEAMSVIDTQPGAEFAPGTWWNAYNAVTFMTDHTLGRSQDSRLQSAWFGVNRNLKREALELATEMADA